MILAIICCRKGSKGVAGKNIRPLHGKPLIVYTIDVAKKCSLINDILISTDSEEIAAIGKLSGINVPFIRPANLATDTSSKWPVFIHALEEYEKQTGKSVEYLVDLDVTVPLKTVEDIEGAIKKALNNPAADVIITGYEPERNPYFNMMQVSGNGFAEMVKKSDKTIVRRQDAPEVYSLTPAAYVIKKSALYNFEHWSKAKCMVHPIPRERAVDIDTEIDFKIVEFLMDYKK